MGEETKGSLALRGVISGVKHCRKGFVAVSSSGAGGCRRKDSR